MTSTKQLNVQGGNTSLFEYTSDLIKKLPSSAMEDVNPVEETMLEQVDKTSEVVTTTSKKASMRAQNKEDYLIPL
jgi:hypothetical protein